MSESKFMVAVLKSFFSFGETQKDRTAVVDHGGERLTTFGNLIDVVNSFGSYLKKRGIKKGDCIAICLGRTMEHIAFRIAAESMGIVYVSINNDYPKERKEKIVRSCQAKLVVSEDIVSEIEIGKNPCCLDEDIEDSEKSFIFFTSGTTGRPKGILHNRTIGCLETSLQKMFFRTIPEIRHAAFSDFMFIMTVIDESCLHAGGTLYIVDNDMRCDIPRLRDFFIEHKITTTGIFPDLLFALGKDIPLSVALVAGSSSKHDFRGFEFLIMNVYGCSECPIISFHEINSGRSFIGETIPEGKIMLFDDDGRESGRGEICYKGPAIMEKYMGDPELTNNTIYIDPSDGRKVIRTGDLGARCDEGIEIVGRKDSMVKIRGNRVEPADVEFCINNIDGVDEAVVKTFTDDSGEQYLCAFFTSGKDLTDDRLVRQIIKKMLPPYMMPKYIVRLDSFPHNANGKIERTKLFLPASLSDKEFVEARTDEEKALAEAVKKVLKIEKVNMADNFYEIGGDSIQAIFVVAALRRSGFELSMMDVARSDTLGKIALLLKRISEDDGLSILNGEKTALPGSATIHSLFEDTVAKKGDEICIVTDDKNYTFAEFNDLVKLLDFEIRKITGGKKQTIALVAERSVEMYASIYAIVRGGNAYLPIDPTCPKERIEYMLEDSGAEIVLAQDRFCGLFDKIKVLNISEIIKNRNVTTEELSVSALPEDTAYMIYTSGSTGRPKGAKISQRSLLNRILWMEKQYPLDEKSVILQKTPYTFDVSLWEIFWWTVSGGRMAFMKPREHFLPAKIVDEIYSKKIMVIHFVPSVLDLFVKYLESNPGEREKVASLKDIFVSGEVLNAALINRSYAIFSAENIKIHNLYGPTECAVDVSFYDCKARESDPVPIGRPIDNTDIFILDSNMQPVPKGVTGEICISGANVGQGYVNNEDVTNEVFLKNPFGEGKIYKTGDLGYINSENKIIFCGRKDTQIKLNGQRIELAEIENSISEIDGVSLAAVIARKNSEGNQILCAFYSGEKKESGDIRKRLEKKLPRYMIPQTIMHLDEMPLTSSGKIDRNSLAEAGNGNIVSDKEFVEARTKEEKALVAAVKKVLKTDKVSVTDNFFELGGDSIQAIFVVSELQKAGFGLSVADVVLHGTISETALLIKPEDKPEKAEQQAEGEIPLTPIMKIYRSIAGSKLEGFTQTQIVSCGRAGENEIKKVWNAITGHHDMLRSVVRETCLDVKNFEENKFFDLKIEDLRGKKEIVDIIEKETGEPLDPENGPLVKLTLYLEDTENFLKIAIHHFVIDGVSWRIIYDDFKNALEQLHSGKEIKLPEKTAPFRAWVEYLEDHKNRASANESKYWNGILDSLDKTQNIIPRRDENGDGAEYLFTLEKELTEQLLTKAGRAFGTHADELLLSALGTALREIRGGNDFGVCVESHGRERLCKNIDTSRTVGWFTAYFPVILKCKKSLGETIVSVKETMRRVPEKGASYPLLFGKIPEKTELIFNFVGTLKEKNDYAFEMFRKNALRNAIPDKIMVNGIVSDGKLCVLISLKGDIRTNIVADIGKEYEKQIRDLISYCAVYKESVKTLSDYSDPDLNESELEEFERMFAEDE